MKNQNLQTLKGFRDFLPIEKKRRDYIESKIIKTFKLFGFEPLETPTLEYASLLLGKYGEEADRLVYSFKDRGGREVALKYDQTVPTARVLAQHRHKFPKYFRRYQIQNIFRADKPQKGRFREFVQCDGDIFGSTSPLADAEILTVFYKIFEEIGFENITLKLNDRNTLIDALAPYASKRVDVFSIIQTIDKLDKLTKDDIVKELTDKGLAFENAKLALRSIDSQRPSKNLKSIIDYSKQLGIPENNIIYSKTLARGLDYYTGFIFEGAISGYGAGSVGGGGRYDKLINQLSGVDVSAVGFGLGFDRTVEAAEQFGLIPKQDTSTEVLITVFDPNLLYTSLELAKKLRQNDISCQVYPSLDKLDKQLKYASKNDIPYVAILGPNEIKKGVIQLKNMKNKTQKEMKINEIFKIFQ